jgi:hypothetical protein
MMKKNILIMFMIFTTAFLMAELVIDIPFSQNIIGEDYSEVGNYQYESEWITMTNTGNSTQTYFLMYTYDTASLPAGWTLSVCNPITCFMPFFNVPIELASGASDQLSIHIGVASTGGIDLNMTFTGGDLDEPVSLDFTFNTADNVSSQENIIVREESLSNYPNPFNPETNISFFLLESAQVDLEIYDLKGQLIRNLGSDIRPAGENNFTWNGTNDLGETVSSGLYFFKLKAGTYTSTRKMMLMK